MELQTHIAMPFYKILGVVLLLAGNISRLAAQEVQINETPAVAELYKAWTNQNRTNPHMEGWRVQIMASTDRPQVEEGRLRFRTAYPEIHAEMVHEKPYYKLKVGAFKSRLEALAFIATIPEFAGAYPSKDSQIHPRDFLKNN
jgi:hypothetical protein